MASLISCRLTRATITGCVGEAANVCTAIARMIVGKQSTRVLISFSRSGHGSGAYHVHKMFHKKAKPPVLRAAVGARLGPYFLRVLERAHAHVPMHGDCLKPRMQGYVDALFFLPCSAGASLVEPQSGHTSFELCSAIWLRNAAKVFPQPLHVSSVFCSGIDSYTAKGPHM